MSIFKTNKDLDSTLIVFGIHLLLAGVIVAEVIGKETQDLSGLLTNLVIIYGMICSYFFKTDKKANGTEDAPK